MKIIWKTKTSKRTITLSLHEVIEEMVNDEYDSIIEECTRHKSKPLFLVTPTKEELKGLMRLLIVPAFLSLFKNAMLNRFMVAFRMGTETIGYLYQYRHRLIRYEKKTN